MVGKKYQQIFKNSSGAAVHQALGIRISVPRLGYMAVRSEQPFANQKTRTGDTRPNPWILLAEAYVIDAINVTDRVSVPIQEESGCALLLLQLFDLL